jgi:hypothetical protein
MALEMGGYVGGSQAGTQEQTASVTLRVPADRFDELLTRLQELPDVALMSMSTREEDVTRQIVDLDARIRNLEASEASSAPNGSRTSSPSRAGSTRSAARSSSSRLSSRPSRARPRFRP